VISARWPLAILLCASLAACGSDEPGDVPTFAELDQAVLTPRCTAPCHSGGEFAAGGLDLQPDSHAALVDVPATAPACVGQGKRVVAGDPGASLLYSKVIAKIDGTAPPCGETMPLGADVPALPEEEAEMIRKWIAAGALDD
jgi:hypothetical protein